MSKKVKVDKPLASLVADTASAMAEIEASALSEATKALAGRALLIHAEMGDAMQQSLTTLAGEVHSLQFGTKAHRALLVMDVNRVALIADPDIREKVLDRIHASLKTKPPDPPKRQPTASGVVHDGKLIDVPARYADVTL